MTESFCPICGRPDGGGHEPKCYSDAVEPKIFIPTNDNSIVINKPDEVVTMRSRLMKIHQYITAHPRLIYWGGFFDACLVMLVIYCFSKCFWK